MGGAVAVYGVILFGGGLHQQDVGAYLQGARDLLAGRPLYASFLHHPFPDPTLRPAYIYPPAFAVLLSPLALLPETVAVLCWQAINQIALIAALVVGARGLKPSRWALAAMIVATATFYPLWIDAVQGQANLLILLLTTIGVFGVLLRGPQFAIALGVAAALKLTPALVLMWLLIDRRWRAAAWMAGGFALVTALGAVFRLQDSVTFFSRVLPALAHGTAFYANQSISGFLLRVSSVNPYTDPWISFALPMVLIALVMALLLGYWLWRTADASPSLRVLAFLPLIPLASAVTWPHHLVILLPAIWAGFAAIAERGWPRVPTATLVAVLLGFDLLTRLPASPAYGTSGFRLAQTQDPLVVLTANAMLLATLTLFLAAPWLLRSR